MNTNALSDRFWSKVNKTETCWLWTAALDANGYGVYVLPRAEKPKRRNIGPHRLVAQKVMGLDVTGMDVDHKCHVPACVRPDHLQVVTHQQNAENRKGAQRTSKTGVRGVHWSNVWGMYVAIAQVGSKRHYGGRFDRLEDAEAAVIELRNRVMTNNLVDRRSQDEAAMLVAKRR